MNTPPSAVGILLDGAFALVAEYGADEKVVTRYAAEPPVPPATLVPWFPGEPPRGDAQWPPHPRGTGEKWPPESEVHPEFGSGRCPVAFAWQLLEADQSWNWVFEEGTHRLRPADAIAALVGDVTDSLKVKRNSGLVTLPIPNDLRQNEQQKLADAGRRLSLPIKLIWRPVAAAISWCQRYHSDLSQRRVGSGNGRSEQSLGQLLVLYLGIDSIEATLLDIVPRRHEGVLYFLPGRKRPEHSSRTVDSLGSGAFQQEALRFRESDRIDDELSRAWQTTWCSPWLIEVLRGISGDRHPSPDHDVAHTPYSLQPGEAEQIWHRIVSEPGRSNGLPTIGPSQPKGTLSVFALQDLARQLGRELVAENPLGVLLVGPLANASLPNGRTLGDFVITAAGFPSGPIFTEGNEVPFGILAEGACIHSARVLADQPSYLDTLPRMQTVIRRNGEPEWIDLLNEQDQFVEGGQLWSRPENVSGLDLPEESEDLTLAVYHDEYKYVREVITDLPTVVESREPVGLAVTIEPAQGNARIEIVPDDTQLFGRRRVSIDWQRMEEFKNAEGNAVDRERYLDTLPRIFPGLLPRLSSPPNWESARAEVEWLTERLQGSASLSRYETDMKGVIDSLRNKDQSYYPYDATAVSSTGTVLLGQKRLDALVHTALDALEQSGGQVRLTLIRLLACTSTADPRFAKAIMKELKAHRVYSDRAVLSACGSCLRKPKMIAQFAELLLERLESGRGPNNWLQAFSEILRFRDDAAKGISSDFALEISSSALKLLEAERRKRSGNFIFRNACLIIVYLLRRRAYDDNYLDPESEFAEKAKSAFRSAIRDSKAGKIRLIGGSVDLSQQLQLMIDYIDRRGRGRLLIGQ